MAAEARRTGRTPRRNLADLDRSTARLLPSAHRARQGLRSGWNRHRAAQRALSDERRRAVFAHRSGRSAAGNFCDPQHVAFRRRPPALRLVAGYSGALSFRDNSKRNREKRVTRCLALLAVAICLLSAAAPASAQPYPSRPVTIIVPYPAG